MTNPSKPPGDPGQPPRFPWRVVGSVARIPEPIVVTIPKAGKFTLDILTAEEFRRLGPLDDPQQFEEVRPGVFIRFRWGGAGENGPRKPDWM